MYSSKFRNERNVRYTKSLFFELVDEKATTLYSLRSEDCERPSLYRLYLAEADLTEYDFANKYFEGLDHWEIICKASWFRPLVTKWRRELRLKLESQVFKAIVQEAEEPDSKNRFSANKMIWEKLQKANPRGRPTKEEVEGELKRETHAEKQLQEDLKRIS